MKLLKHLLPILLLAAPAWAADIGYFERADCGTLTPVAESTVCLQTTTVSGRSMGVLYIFKAAGWTAVGLGTATPGGSDTQVQFNDGGATLGGDAGMVFNKTTNVLTVTGDILIGAQSVCQEDGTNCPVAGAGDVTDVLGTTNEIEITNSSGPQPQVGIAANFRISGKTATAPVKAVAAVDPATCTQDDLVINRGGTSGQRLKLCESTNTWVVQGGGAPDSADYVVGTAHASLSAERVGTDTATIDFDIGTAAQAKWNVVANSIGAAQINETDAFTWSGANAFTGALAYGATSPAQITGDQNNYTLSATVFHRISTDASRTITGFTAPATWDLKIIANVGSFDLVIANESASSTAANRVTTVRAASLTIPTGAMAFMFYDVTSARWRAFDMRQMLTAEVDTLDTVFDRGKTIDGATSFANGFRVTDASGDGVVIYRSAANGPTVTCVVATVENDCNKIVKLNASMKWEVQDDAAGAIVSISEAGVTTYGASYRPKKSIWFGAGSLSTDGTQCAAPAEVTLASGPKTWTIICTDNDASTIYGNVRMPDSWDAGTITFAHVYVQTAADTAVLNGDIAAQCRGNGEAVSNTWGTEIAIDDAAVVGTNSVDQTTSAAVTPAGTCAAGDMLWFRYQLDATGTTTAVATLHHLGFNLEYSLTTLSD